MLPALTLVVVTALAAAQSPHLVIQSAPPGVPVQLAFTPDGKRLLVLTPSEVEVWDPATHQKLGAFASPTRFAGSLSASLPMAVHPDGRRIVFTSAAPGASAELWDWTTGERVRTFSADGQIVAISPDGKTLAIIGKTLSVCDLETGAVIKAVPSGQDWVG